MTHSMIPRGEVTKEMLAKYLAEKRFVSEAGKVRDGQSSVKSILWCADQDNHIMIKRHFQLKSDAVVAACAKIESVPERSRSFRWSWGRPEARGVIARF